MGKDGVWVVGIEMEPVEDGAEFAINPERLRPRLDRVGQVSERLGESFVPLTEPMPPTPAAPDGAVRGWEQQFGMHLREMEAQADLIFRTSSVGGKRAIGALAKEVGARLAAGDAKCVPIVTLAATATSTRSTARSTCPSSPSSAGSRRQHRRRGRGDVAKSGAKAAPAKADAEGQASRCTRR